MRRSLLAGLFVEGIENTRLPTCLMFRELVGGAGFVGGNKQCVWDISWPTSRSIRYRHPPVGDCSPGRGGVVQDGEKRAEMFHGGMDR